MTRQDILDYAGREFGTEPEYLWVRYPNYAVLRHAGNSKWYAIIADIPKTKAGLSGDGVVDILDVKCETALIGMLLKTSGYIPAYHMNKQNWIGIRLDGSVSDDEVFRMLDRSFDLTK